MKSIKSTCGTIFYVVLILFVLGSCVLLIGEKIREDISNPATQIFTGVAMIGAGALLLVAEMRGYFRILGATILLPVAGVMYIIAGIIRALSHY